MLRASSQVQPRDPDRALQLIETCLRYQLTGNPRCSAAVIIEYGETVVLTERDSLPLTRV